MKNIGSFILITWLLAVSCSQPTIGHKIQFTGEAQGTYYVITYFADDTLISQHQIDSVLADFDLIASIWQPNSLISRINRNETTVVDNKYFSAIFNLSQRIAKETGGAFDITVGPLVNAWGFGFKNRMDMTKEKVDSILHFVGFQLIRLENGQIIKDNPNIQLDFNAIAKGYSIDVIGGFLESAGIKNYLVDIGGEVLARGTKPDDEKWIIGIEKPSDEATSERKLKATIKVEDIAVATSGNYRKFYIKDGIKFAHTIDPATGFPVVHSLLSATVFSDSTARSDAYATAFMVMGVEKAKEFLDRNPSIEAYLIYADETGKIKTFATKGISEMLNEL
ncbi:MAG TPA: FAD:protein FMN transferase [Bacteroidales bacterium]|nr:FAD:protein FMN transferase [Bacteroidales bacterium]